MVVLLLAAAAALHASASSGLDALALERQYYHDAVSALDQRRWDDFATLRQKLDTYPLAVYLDYYQLTRQAHTLSPQDANAFLQRSADTPLSNRFLSVYLGQAGKRGRWSDFLDVMPDEPNSVVLKCYYFRAKLAAGERETAWAGAARLWVHGRSQPDECDPLFEAWQKAGQLNDSHVWARMLAAFDAGQSGLMKYVAKKGSGDLRPWMDKLRKVYASPRALITMKLPEDSTYSADIATQGLPYLARYSPEQALATWLDLKTRLVFDAEQSRKIEYAIARRSLFARTDSHRNWLHGALGSLGDDSLTGIRLRWALKDGDWRGLEDTLPLLSADAQQESVWRYWQAYAMEQRGASEEAQAILEELSTERDYYGFLAADKLGRPYVFNERALTLEATDHLEQLPALARIEELNYHERHTLAHSEWYKVLSDSGGSADQQEQLAQLASERGWHRMAIDAASRAKAWDALDVRFPLAFQTVFDYHAAEQGVPGTELMAISRRESAFFPQARSPVGARGLMQIMPATGRQVAASINSPHSTADLYEVKHNVLLGSTYYRQLLDRFDGNRIFALAAYNAGPHRVDRWRNDPADALPAEIWVETIPFKETRRYVQAVLAYNLVFKYRKGEDKLALLSEAEKQLSY